jgi:recombinational DNA repair protein RecT
VAVYAIATDANGRKWHKILDWANIEKRMRLSKSKDRDGNLTGPWKEWPEEMAQTKCIRELAKLIGQREFNTTLAEVEEQDWIDVSPEPTIASPLPTAAEASQERPEVVNEYNQEQPPNDLPPIEEDDLPF